MAQAIACDLCGQESAVMLETRIETGEVIAVGVACLIPFYTGATGSLYDTMGTDDAAAFAPAIQALSAKWAAPDDTNREVMPDEGPASKQMHVPGLPNSLDVTGASAEAPDGLAGTEDASVSGEGVILTPDTPARQARNRTGTPK